MGLVLGQWEGVGSIDYRRCFDLGVIALLLESIDLSAGWVTFSLLLTTAGFSLPNH